MRHHAWGCALGAALALAIFVGCDNDSESAAGGGSGASSDAPAAAADPGKPVAKADQLLGSWFRQGVLEDPIGVEFASDGKVMIYGRGGGAKVGAVTLNYTMLEGGGRLRLALPGSEGLGTTATVNVNGNVLTLKEEAVSEMFQLGEGTYEKLPAGKTVVARAQERVKERQAEQAEIEKKLDEWLGKPGLAIVPEDNAPGGFRLGIDLKKVQGSWQGTAYHEGVNDIVFQRKVNVFSTRLMDDQGQGNEVVVNVGQVVAPPGARQLEGETFKFNATAGKGGEIVMNGQGRSLVHDPSVLRGLTEKYELALKKQRELIDGFFARLGAFAIYEGDMQYPNAGANARPNVYRVAMMRVKDKDQYMLAEMRPSLVLTAASFNRPIGVEVYEGKPLLRNQGELYFIAEDDKGSGPVTLQVQANGMVGRLTPTKSMSFEQLDAHRAKVAAFLDGMSKQPLVLYGHHDEAIGYEHSDIQPMRVSLSCPDKKTLKGTCYAGKFQLEAPVTGQVTETLLGLIMEFTIPDQRLPSGQVALRGKATGELSLENDQPRLVGKIMPGDANNLLLLEHASAERTKKDRELLESHLAKGGAFLHGHAGSTPITGAPITLILKSGDGGKLSGTAGFPRNVSGPVTGTIGEDSGHVIVDLDVPAATVARYAPQGCKIRLTMVPFTNGWALIGRNAADPKNLQPMSMVPGEVKQ
jgi:hypothetical protein